MRHYAKKCIDAYATRASDQGPNAGKWDNTAIIEEIMTLRVELAKLLGFNTYTERSLATKMAENPQQVLDFLNNLAYRSKAQGEKELAELKAYCEKNLASLNLRLGISVSIPKNKNNIYMRSMMKNFVLISLKIALFRAYLN